MSFTAVIAVTALAAQTAISNLFTTCSNSLGELLELSDGLVPGGSYTGTGAGNLLSIRMVNCNNHQLTVGVARAAIIALKDYMSKENDYGWVNFQIWDGDNQVGLGMLTPGV